MADWLRPVFARTKSSLNIPQSPLLGSEDENEDDPKEAPKVRSSSRLPSLGMLRSVTPPLLDPEPFARVRPHLKAYERPDVDRQVETLKVTMMNHDPMKAIPRENYSIIMHLLEAYHEIGEALVQKKVKIAELELARAKDAEQFETLTSQWQIAEKVYLAEVKRLEIMLSKTGGLEMVTMARSNSRVYGARKFSEMVGKGIEIVKDRNKAGDLKDGEEAFNEDTNWLYRNATKAKVSSTVDPHMINSQSHTEAPENDEAGHVMSGAREPILQDHASSKGSELDRDISQSSSLAASSENEVTIPAGANVVQLPEQASELVKMGEGYQSEVESDLTRTNLNDLQELRRARGQREHTSVFDTSTSGSSLESIGGTQANQKSTSTVISLRTPRIFTNSMETSQRPSMDATSTQTSEPGNSQQVPTVTSRFSFQAGDDRGMLSSRGEYLLENGGNFTQYTVSDENNLNNAAYTSTPPKQIDLLVKENSQLLTKIPKLRQRKSEEDTRMSRGDSLNSVVTAVLHSSEHGSQRVESPSRTSNRGASKGKGRASGSKEAITAATKAYKDGRKKHDKAKAGKTTQAE